MIKQEYLKICNEMNIPSHEPLMEKLIEFEKNGTNIFDLSGNQLRLFNNRMKDDDIAVLIELLKRYDNVKVVELRLPYNQISDKGASTISTYLLQSECPLQHLNLFSNNVGFSGCKDICNALMTNRTLKSLSFEHNPVTNQGLSLLSDVIEINNELQSINIGYTDLNSTAFIKLSINLKKNISLRYLDLSGSVLATDETDEITHLCEALKVHPQLCSLSLNSIKLNDKQLKLILNYLTDHPNKIKELFLSKNKISFQGLQHLKDYVLTTNQLEVITLNGNNIGDDGGSAIGDILRGNNTLSKCDLRMCSIGDIGLLAIAQGLRDNRTINQLLLWGNIFGNASASLFHEILPTIRRLGVDIDITTDFVDDVAYVARG